MTTQTKITRAAYMNLEITHEEFYDAVAARLNSRYLFSEQLMKRVKAALASGDVHLNSIPLSEWDAIADRVKMTVSAVLKEHGDSWSLAGGICTVKQAAKTVATL